VSTHIVIDLGFGDAGKGTTVDAIARRCSTPPLVVRHNGGAQAGHNVVSPDGKQHVFSQFGAATFVPGSKTLLSKHFVLHPTGLLAEHDHLVSIGVWDALSRLFIDERALVITPFHQAANRLREKARGAGRHGTCGVGVGETVADRLNGLPTLCAADLQDPVALRMKLEEIRRAKRVQLSALIRDFEGPDPDLEVFSDPTIVQRTFDIFKAIGSELQIVSPSQSNALIHKTEHVIFEGAQGVLLDEWYGFHPHTTWSTTTTRNADRLIEDAGRPGPVRRIGVVRAYATRHGEGPFPTEDAALTDRIRDSHNVDSGWQGKFRVGWFDLPLTRYALSLCPGITELSVTCLDRLADAPEWSICEAYSVPSEIEERFLMKDGLAVALRSNLAGDLTYQELLTNDLPRCSPVTRKAPEDVWAYLREIEAGLGVPVSVASFGPKATDKVWVEPGRV